MKLTKKQILENRKRVIDHLLKPNLRKTKEKLRNIKSGGRCCLGHMCDAFPEYITHNSGWYNEEKLDAPDKLVELIGLNGSTGLFLDELGSNIGVEFEGKTKKSLIAFNDETNLKPRDIAILLHNRIKGGPGTPWKAIKV